MAQSMEVLSSSAKRLPVLITRNHAGWSTSLLIFLRVKGVGGHVPGGLLPCVVRFRIGAGNDNGSDDSWGGMSGKYKADERVVLRRTNLECKHQLSIQATACVNA